jgi:hypothetical protein
MQNEAVQGEFLSRRSMNSSPLGGYTASELPQRPGLREVTRLFSVTKAGLAAITAGDTQKSRARPGPASPEPSRGPGLSPPASGPANVQGVTTLRQAPRQRGIRQEQRSCPTHGSPLHSPSLTHRAPSLPSPWSPPGTSSPTPPPPCHPTCTDGFLKSGVASYNVVSLVSQKSFRAPLVTGGGRAAPEPPFWVRAEATSGLERAGPWALLGIRGRRPTPGLYCRSLRSPPSTLSFL